MSNALVLPKHRKLLQGFDTVRLPSGQPGPIAMGMRKENYEA